MDEQTIAALKEGHPILEDIAQQREVAWINPDRIPFEQARPLQELSMEDIDDAENRLARFAPFIQKCFPETASRKGIIESDLVDIACMRESINAAYDSALAGRLLLKKDSHLAIAGSVKARGGIYEVLKHTEDLALENGLISPEEASDNSPGNTAYAKLADDSAREIFGRYTVQVGSTGNLGMSIGIMSAAVGYHVIVHMSADARQWKKDRLRSFGVEVVEYESDYGEAVRNGRMRSDADPTSYFVDDENSRDLFLGYAVAAKRLPSQLAALDVAVDEEHPLFVYIPCGVGGAPGGISFGLKQVYGDAVHCFFVEPTQAPCMLVGMVSGLNSAISVQDIGLTGLTHADGLAVGRPSGFVGGVMKPHLSGEFTVSDPKLYDYMRDLIAAEDVFLEPSACAAFQGPIRLGLEDVCKDYIEQNDLAKKMANATHIAWATGGSLVPDDIRRSYEQTHLD
ncbi:MAG: D-serine ammonia-lyase [Eggerthellaceae bacterium]|nr:D-serine ammonia-lyase [Eggerthellaceae bacterium]